jgi:hypothetical protein
VHYFAQAIKSWPAQKHIFLHAASVQGLSWINRDSRAVLKLYCRPTSSEVSRKVTTISICSMRKALSQPIELEGDVKVEASSLSAWLTIYRCLLQAPAGFKVLRNGRMHVYRSRKAAVIYLLFM